MSKTRRQLRSIARYDFEGGGYVDVLVYGDVSTTDAIAFLKEKLALKQQELDERTHNITLASSPSERER